MLHVQVGRPRYLFISFRPVRSDDWAVEPDKSRMQRILNRLNRVYRNQGNIRFREVGSQPVTVAGLPDKVMKSDMGKFKTKVSGSADVTMFFVPDFEVFGTSWKKMIFIDSGTTQKGGRDTKIVCHEVGHYMGLPHPTVAVPNNMMNKGNNNQPHWVSLNGTQIGKISNWLNWK